MFCILANLEGPGEKAEWRNGGIAEWRNGGMDIILISNQLHIAMLPL